MIHQLIYPCKSRRNQLKHKWSTFFELGDQINVEVLVVASF